MKIASILLLSLLTAALTFWAAHPESASPASYSARGPYAVGTLELRLEDGEYPLEITLWYPAQKPDSPTQSYRYDYGGLFEMAAYALPDAPWAEATAPWPLLLFSHGSGGFRLQSTFLAEHLASYGVVVAAPDHPGDSLREALGGQLEAEQLPAHLLSRQLELRRTVDALTVAFGERVDVERLIVSGHSLGATSALIMAGARLNPQALADWCATASFGQEICAFDATDNAKILAEIAAIQPDTRVRGLLLLAPWAGPLLDLRPLAEDALPGLLIAGSADRIAPTERDALRIHAAWGQSTTLVMLNSAGHFVFVDRCPEAAITAGLSSLCSDGVWDMLKAHQQINHFGAAFVRALLYDDARAAAALEPRALLAALAEDS